MQWLVTTEELAANLQHPDWVLFDTRHNLLDTEAGREAYREGHLPGAIFLHLDEDLSAPKTGKNGRHPLPDPHVFAARMAVAGVTANKRVVAYDDSSGVFASRLWWMLRWIGHDNVALLDGGFPKWVVEQRPLSHTPPAPRAAATTLSPRQGMHVETATVARHLDEASHLLLDARSPDRFRGEKEPFDPVAGHIPGARNRFCKHNLKDDGTFLPRDELHAAYTAILGSLDPRQVIHYCGSGVTACHNLLAMELAGLAGSRLYAGSWSEWVADSSRPVATGG